jgi:RNA polymerase sigma-70 factor (ECF subfamily)
MSAHNPARADVPALVVHTTNAGVEAADGVDEQRWLRLIRGGDVAAFEALYRAYHMRLRAFVANYVRSTEIADEVVQDLMCHLWEHRGALHVRGTVRSYLYLAARNRALNVAKHQQIVARVEKRWESTTSEDVAIPGMGQGMAPPDDRLRDREFAIAVSRAVAGLPDRARLAWGLRWQHQLAHAEIAVLMGISIKGVEALLARSLRALQQALTDFR